MRIQFIHDDCVIVNNAFKTLYGLKVVSGTESFVTADKDKVATTFRRGINSGRKDNFLFEAVKRTRVQGYPVKGSTYKTEVFLFTFSPVILDEVSDVIPTARKMTGGETANALFRCHTLADEYYWRNKQIVNDNIPIFSKDTIFVPPVGRKYTEFFYNEIKKREGRKEYPFRVIKGLSPNTAEPDMETLFSLGWTGTLWLRFNFNNIYSVVKARSNLLSADKERKYWKDFAERYKAGEETIAILDTTFITSDKKPPYIPMFNALSLTPLEWFKDREKVIAETPLSYVDENFGIFIYPDRASNYAVSSFAKNYSAKGQADTIYGVNKNSEYTTYSFFKEAQSPHSLIIAPTRSGKSFFSQDLVTEMANVNVEKLFKGTIKPFKLPIFVRYFDVGFSAEFLVELMKRRGFSVAVMNPMPDLRVNVMEIDSIEEVDISINLVNLILATKGMKPLNAVEEGFFRKATEFIMMDKKKFVYAPKIGIFKGEYPKAYARALELGYKDTNLISDLKEHDFDNFKYPTINDVIRMLNKMENNLPEGDKQSREVLTGLTFKLKAVEGIPNFKYWSDTSISGKDFVYFDLNNLKGTSLFVPAYMGILVRTIRQLKKADPKKIKLFINDEFHNVSKYEVFSKFFTVLAREAAKYNIYLVFISQNAEDVSKETASNIATKVFLKPASDEPSTGKKESPSALFEESVKEHYALNKEVVNQFNNLPKYTPLFIYPSGWFTLRMPVDEYKAKVFESREITEITTPDGIKIVKSYVNTEGE